MFIKVYRAGYKKVHFTSSWIKFVYSSLQDRLSKQSRSDEIDLSQLVYLELHNSFSCSFMYLVTIAGHYM